MNKHRDSDFISETFMNCRASLAFCIFRTMGLPARGPCASINVHSHAGPAVTTHRIWLKTRSILFPPPDVFASVASKAFVAASRSPNNVKCSALASKASRTYSNPCHPSQA